MPGEQREPRTWQPGPQPGGLASGLNAEVRDHVLRSGVWALEAEGDIIVAAGMHDAHRLAMGGAGVPLVGGEERPVYERLDARGLAPGFNRKVLYQAAQPTPSEWVDGDIWLKP